MSRGDFGGGYGAIGGDDGRASFGRPSGGGYQQGACCSNQLELHEVYIRIIIIILDIILLTLLLLLLLSLLLLFSFLLLILSS